MNKLWKVATFWSWKLANVSNGLFSSRTYIASAFGLDCSFIADNCPARSFVGSSSDQHVYIFYLWWRWRLSQYGQKENKQDYVDTRTRETRPHRLFIMEVRFIYFHLTCAGAAINPTAIPATTRPTSMRKCDDAVARKIHPKKSGTIASMRAGLRPQRSMMGPEANEPTGVARLWTLAEKEGEGKTRKCYYIQNRVIKS